MEQYRQYCEKFLQITPREQYLVTLSGFVVIVLLIFNLFIDSSVVNINRHDTVIKENQSTVDTNQQSIQMMEVALTRDPNESVNEKIARLEKNLSAVDKELLALTSDLINPVQMRLALLELLKMQKGVSLVSFEVSPAEPLLTLINDSDSEQVAKTDSITSEPVTTEGLYKHSITLKLTGKYFKLRDYLAQLEQMSWTFFWQDFDFKLKEYPVNELEVTLYSLSTKQEFIGV